MKYPSFKTFAAGRDAAKILAKALRTTVLLTYSEEARWQVHFPDGSQISDIVEYLKIFSPQPEPDTITEEEYREAMEEHDFTNADYYREKKLIHESSHEEYLRYLYT